MLSESSNAAASSTASSSQESSTSASTSVGSTSANFTPDDIFDISSSGQSSGLGLSTPPIPSSSQFKTSSLPAIEPQPIEKIVPMSFGQSRFWFMSQLVTDPTAFNITCSMLIAGEVKIHDLARAVRDLGSRHEALRTCFFNSKHQSMQRVLVKSPLHLETLNLSSQEDIQQQFQGLKSISTTSARGRP